MKRAAKEDEKYWLYSKGSSVDLEGFDIYTEATGFTTKQQSRAKRNLRDLVVPEEAKSTVIRSLIDTQVYKQHMSMRTLYSTKVDNCVYRPLVYHANGFPILTNPTDPVEFRKWWKRNRFMDCLVGYVSPICQIAYLVSASVDEKSWITSFDRMTLPSAISEESPRP